MSVLAQLLAQKSELEAAAQHERLARSDAAVEAFDKAQALRDTLMEQHDRMVADAIAYGRHPPDLDPGLNLSEIALRKASGEARAAAKARADIEEELQSINERLGVLACGVCGSG